MPGALAHRLGDLYVRVGDRWFADDAVGLRHLPLTVSLAVVLATLSLSDVPSSVPALLVASGVIGAVVQLVASLGRWDRWPRGWRYLLPLAQMVAVGLLELGSGLPLAGFDVLLFLPVVNLALQPGILGLVLALGASTVVAFAPVAVGFVEVGRVNPLMHALVDLLVAGLVAVGAHMIVGLARRQATQLEHARDETAVTAQRLRDSRDTLRGILQAATEQGFVATDFAGRIVSVNPGAERIFGRPERELVGTDVAGLVAAEALAERLAAAGPQRWDHAANRAVLGRAVAGETQVDDWETVLPDGTRRRVELTVTERPALGGRDPELPEGYLVVVTDVTARYEEERTQDEFIGLVSHELRTPLASIFGYVDLMRLEGDRLDEEQRGYLEVVDRNARRLRSLVDDLLTSAQMVSGRYTLAADEIDVAQVVREAVANERPSADAAGVAVEVDGDARVPLRSDSGRVGQVVDNLLSNAVKYSERGGRVRVTVTAGTGPQGGRLARLQVADEGSGIPADELEHITERFYRSRDTRRRRVRGVGLGLSLVDQIVHDHGGTMTFRSELGHGTEVDVTLPDVTPAARG
ncbi:MULTISPECIES: sensor histidine kinase [unclassified Isoptericola]|uniref:sensor histidine kinase n=1 Tax=unclassified Isoptericola TaxID=2623355 RepID=UPI00365035AD